MAVPDCPAIGASRLQAWWLQQPTHVHAWASAFFPQKQNMFILRCSNPSSDVFVRGVRILMCNSHSMPVTPICN